MEFTKLLLHPSTRTLLESYLRAPKHALLLKGPRGVGLGTIARSLAHALVRSEADILVVEPDEKGTISIERVRTLYVETRDVQQSKRVVVIDNIDAMSRDAQNALLKLLEEPNEYTYFVATTHEPQELLVTIISRMQTVDVRPISLTSSKLLLEQKGVIEPKIVQQMLFIAIGLPAELVRLAESPEYFSAHSEYVRAARHMLEAPLYDRCVLAGRFSDRASAKTFVEVLGTTLTFMLTRHSDEKLLRAAHAVELTAQRLAANGHVRTQLLNLAFHV